MLVGGLYQVVVGIYKLQVLSVAHLDAPVAGTAESGVGLTDIDDVAQVATELTCRTLVRAVVDDDDFAFRLAQRQGQDAVQALAEHRHGQVVVGHDKRH